jgi:hypothetical protein
LQRVETIFRESLMFRPRFRLSLLFIVVALVAGVSVWLRQAVVRDRNIRELMEEEFATLIPSDDEQNLNTRILNYFFYDNRFYDNISVLQLRIPQIKSAEILHKYRGWDFGGHVEELSLIAWADEDRELSDPFTRRPFPLSQIEFWPNCFEKVGLFWIEGGILVNDNSATMSIKASCDKFSMRLTSANVSCLEKILNALKINPENIELDSNYVDAKFSEIRAFNLFDSAKLEEIDTHNSFTEQGYNEAKK